jgi:hypothetical protein
VWCLQPLSAIGFACGGSAAYKAAVASKIQSVTCVMSETSGGDLYSLDGTNLIYHMDWKASNVEDKITAFLKKNL